MALDQYQVTLSLREDGESVVASVMSIGHPIRGYASFGDNADGHHVLYLFASQPIIPSPGNANQKYGPEYDKMHFENGMIDGYYEEVRKGTPKEYVTIWKAGEDIAPASALMEEYLKMNDTLRNAVVTDNDGRVVRQHLGGLDRFIATGTDMVEVSYPVMTEDEFNTLNNEHLQMRFTVPEWK